MAKGWGSIRSTSGPTVPGATVKVYLAGTSTLASIFSDAALSIAIDQTNSPVVTDDDGTYEFYVATGTYKIVGTKGTLTFTEDNVDIGYSVPAARTIATTSPLTGGGDLSANRTLAFNFATNEVVTGAWSFARVNMKRPWIDVRHPDFGAVGDGVANDTAAIQAAIDNAEAAGGGLVFISPGLYKISTLTIDSPGVVLAGAGPSSRLSTTATTGNVISIGNVGAGYSNAGGVRDLRIVSSVTRTSGYAISVDGAEEGAIERVKFETTGGGGMVFGATGAASGRWFVSRCIVFMQGAFNCLSIQAGNDRYVTDCWFQGNETAGSKAIEILNAGGDWFTNVEAVLCEIGVDLSAAAGKTIQWSSFVNVLADQNTLYGWRLTSSGGAILGIQLLGCWASSTNDASTSARGILASQCSGLTIINPRVLNNGGHGIEVGAAAAGGLLLDGGIIAGNGAAASGTLDGVIVAASSTGYRIVNGRYGQNAGMGNTQRYGINLGTGNDNYIVTGNDTRANGTGGINNPSGTAATRIVTNNI